MVLWCFANAIVSVFYHKHIMSRIMKHIIPIVALCMLLASCNDNPFVYEYYGFWLYNDTDDDLYFVMDVEPDDDVMTPGSFKGFVDRQSYQSMFMPKNDGWEKYIRDSVHFYFGYLDSLCVNGELSHFTLYYMQQEKNLICRMTLQMEEFYDVTHRARTEIHYPSILSSGIPVVFYNPPKQR